MTAACGRNRELLLGPRPARCKAHSRAEADAGSRNPSLSAQADWGSFFVKTDFFAKCQIFLQKTLAMRQSLWYYN